MTESQRDAWSQDVETAGSRSAKMSAGEGGLVSARASTPSFHTRNQALTLQHIQPLLHHPPPPSSALRFCRQFQRRHLSPRARQVWSRDRQRGRATERRALYRRPSEPPAGPTVGLSDHLPGGPSGSPALLQLVSDPPQARREQLSGGGTGRVAAGAAGGVQRERVYRQPAHLHRVTTASVPFTILPDTGPPPSSSPPLLLRFYWSAPHVSPVLYYS